MIVHFLYNVLHEQVNQSFPNWFVASYAVGVLSREQQRHYPEISVIEMELLFSLDRHNTILGQHPLRLAVEVVKAGRRNHQRDYSLKRADYENLEIPEYWIVDPQANQMLIYQLVNGHYRSRKFQEAERIISPTFPAITFTTTQILSASAS
jgi:Uma2 family endonuclease